MPERPSQRWMYGVGIEIDGLVPVDEMGNRWPNGWGRGQYPAHGDVLVLATALSQIEGIRRERDRWQAEATRVDKELHCVQESRRKTASFEESLAARAETAESLITETVKWCEERAALSWEPGETPRAYRACAAKLRGEA